MAFGASWRSVVLDLYRIKPFAELPPPNPDNYFKSCKVNQVNISDLTGTALNPYIAKALGHVGNCEINFHSSGEIAIQLYQTHGESLQRFADGFHCTMRHAGKFYTQHAKDPITAIYRAYIVSRLGEEL